MYANNNITDTIRENMFLRTTLTWCWIIIINNIKNSLLTDHRRVFKILFRFMSQFYLSLLSLETTVIIIALTTVVMIKFFSLPTIFIRTSSIQTPKRSTSGTQTIFLLHSKVVDWQLCYHHRHHTSYFNFCCFYKIYSY